MTWRASAAVACLAACAMTLGGCAPSSGARVQTGLATATQTPDVLSAEEMAEARRLQAMPVGPRRPQDSAVALWNWDWRSALSGRGPQRAFFSEGGAAYAAALAGRADETLTPQDRVAAADAALQSARRSAAVAERTHARAAQDPAGAEPRGALLTAMAAAASADAEAVAQDAAALGVYAGPARALLRERAAELARIAAELEGRAADVARMQAD